MAKVGIFGGTFNPVHKEHVLIARAAKEELSLDSLLIMPTFISPHKSLNPAPIEDRINMLKLAFSDDSGIKISSYEAEKQGKSYTYQTVEEFKKRDPNGELYFIVGGDMLTDFKRWKNPERILDACTLCVFDREDYFTDYKAEEEYFIKTFGKKFKKLNYVGKTSSSTKIRTYSEFGLKCDLIPEKVSDYILEKGLYKGDKYVQFIKDNLKPSRVIHTANVVITAMSKARELSLDENKVKLAATLHDCAKYMDYKDYKDFLLPNGVPEKVVHAFLGANVAEKVLGITDQEVIDAIRYHTSGKANMSTLGKLIFVADMVEEGRTYEGVEILREKYYTENFESCFVECLKEETVHLLKKEIDIYAETLNAYEYYVNNKKRG